MGVRDSYRSTVSSSRGEENPRPLSSRSEEVDETPAPVQVGWVVPPNGSGTYGDPPRLIWGSDPGKPLRQRGLSRGWVIPRQKSISREM